MQFVIGIRLPRVNHVDAWRWPARERSPKEAMSCVDDAVVKCKRTTTCVRSACDMIDMVLIGSRERLTTCSN